VVVRLAIIAALRKRLVRMVGVSADDNKEIRYSVPALRCFLTRFCSLRRALANADIPLTVAAARFVYGSDRVLA
jgi:hypothetical protein